MSVTHQNYWCQCSHFIEKTRPFGPSGIIGFSNQKKTTTNYQQTNSKNQQTNNKNHQKSLPLASSQTKKSQQPTKPSSFFLVPKNWAPGNSSTPRSWFPRLPRCHFEVLRRHSRCLAVKKTRRKTPGFHGEDVVFWCKNVNSWLQKTVWWLDGFKGFNGFGLVSVII